MCGIAGVFGYRDESDTDGGLDCEGFLPGIGHCRLATADRAGAVKWAAVAIAA